MRARVWHYPGPRPVIYPGPDEVFHEVFPELAGSWVWHVPASGRWGLADTCGEAHDAAREALAELYRASDARERLGGAHGASWRPWRQRRAAGRRSIGGGCGREE